MARANLLRVLTPGHSTAAGVFVQNADGQGLGFVRSNLRNPGIGIPCGTCKPFECPAEGALREGKEETGLAFRLNELGPFFAMNAGHSVFVYSAVVSQSVSQGTIDNFRTTEGHPVWIEPRALLSGPYADFNAKMLAHFQVSP